MPAQGENGANVWSSVSVDLATNTLFAGTGNNYSTLVIDGTGKRLLSRRVANDESELLQLLADVLALGDEVIWGIDLADSGAALVIDLLLSHGQHTLYIPGDIHFNERGHRLAARRIVEALRKPPV